MIMEKIIVSIDWCSENFGASLSENVPGTVVITARSFIELKKAVAETLAFHVKGMIADSDAVPAWLSAGDYEFEYEFVSTAALLRSVEPYASLSAISRATGINQNLLSHYANGKKTPRQAQRQRIIDCIHSIGRALMSV